VRWWLRARIDQQRIFAAVLTPASSAAESSAELVRVQPVTIWEPGDLRVAAQPAALTSDRVVLEVPEEQPVTSVGERSSVP
jgi:hypothetical protein